MAKISKATQIPNTLNLSQSDFDNLVAMIAASLEGKKPTSKNNGARHVTISGLSGDLKKKTHIPVPPALEQLPDDHPRVISWFIFENMAYECSPGVYRATTTDTLLMSKKGSGLSITSHTH